jgi:hypothetical protein
VQLDQVTDTWVAGRHVYADGAPLYLDLPALLDKTDAWRRRFDAASVEPRRVAPGPRA